jgi:hypothetical protein
MRGLGISFNLECGSLTPLCPAELAPRHCGAALMKSNAGYGSKLPYGKRRQAAALQRFGLDRMTWHYPQW